MVKTLHIHCRGCGFDPWSGTKIPHYAQINLKKKKLKKKRRGLMKQDQSLRKGICRRQKRAGIKPPPTKKALIESLSEKVKEFPQETDKKDKTGNSPVVQRLELGASTAGGLGSIPGQGTEILWQNKTKQDKVEKREEKIKKGDHEI